MHAKGQASSIPPAFLGCLPPKLPVLQALQGAAHSKAGSHRSGPGALGSRQTDSIQGRQEAGASGPRSRLVTRGPSPINASHAMWPSVTGSLTEHSASGPSGSEHASALHPFLRRVTLHGCSAGMASVYTFLTRCTRGPSPLWGSYEQRCCERSRTSVYVDSCVLFSRRGPPGRMAALSPGAQGAVRPRFTGAVPPPSPASRAGRPRHPCQLLLVPFSILVSVAGVTAPRSEWDNPYFPKSGVQF